MEDKIVYPELNEFLRAQLPQHTGLLHELEEYAKEPYIPIIQPEVAQFLKVFFSFSKPEKILEIGTAIGYSSIFFAGLDKKTEICYNCFAALKLYSLKALKRKSAAVLILYIYRRICNDCFSNHHADRRHCLRGGHGEHRHHHLTKDQKRQ